MTPSLKRGWAFFCSSSRRASFCIGIGGRKFMQNDNPGSVLKKVIETARDGEKGFREAAEHFKNPSLKAMAQEVSAERARFARELEPELQTEGKDEKIGGSMEGALHRAW